MSVALGSTKKIPVLVFAEFLTLLLRLNTSNCSYTWLVTSFGIIPMRWHYLMSHDTLQASGHAPFSPPKAPDNLLIDRWLSGGAIWRRHLTYDLTNHTSVRFNLHPLTNQIQECNCAEFPTTTQIGKTFSPGCSGLGFLTGPKQPPLGTIIDQFAVRRFSDLFSVHYSSSYTPEIAEA